MFRSGFQSGQQIFWLCFQRFTKEWSGDVTTIIGCFRVVWLCMYLPISLMDLCSCCQRLLIWPLVCKRYFLGVLLLPQLTFMTGAPECFTISRVIFSLTSLSHDVEGLTSLIDCPQMFPIFLQVLRSSQRDSSTTSSNALGRLHIKLHFTRLMTEKVSMVCLYYLWQSFWFSCLSSCSVRRRG